MQEREEMITQLELASEEIWLSGKGAHWFRDGEEIIKKVTEGVNGFLLEQLLIASQYLPSLTNFLTTAKSPFRTA